MAHPPTRASPHAEGTPSRRNVRRRDYILQRHSRGRAGADIRRSGQSDALRCFGRGVLWPWCDGAACVMVVLRGGGRTPGCDESGGLVAVGSVGVQPRRLWVRGMRTAAVPRVERLRRPLGSRRRNSEDSVEAVATAGRWGPAVRHRRGLTASWLSNPQLCGLGRTGRHPRPRSATRRDARQTSLDSQRRVKAAVSSCLNPHRLPEASTTT